MLEIETVAILGAERDAIGLALLCALAGLDVRVADERQEALDGAFRALRADVERALTEGRIDREQRQRIFDGILFTPELAQAVVGADLVCATAPGDAAAARALVGRLVADCRATTLLATPHDPAAVADGATQPGRVVGLALALDGDLFPRVALRPGPVTTAHARDRGGQLVDRLNRASGAHR